MGLGEGFEEVKGEGDDQADVFNIIQKRPNTGVHLKVVEVVEDQLVGGEPEASYLSALLLIESS